MNERTQATLNAELGTWAMLNMTLENTGKANERRRTVRVAAIQARCRAIRSNHPRFN